MGNDFILVIGIVIGVLAIPAIASALSDRRSPRVSAFVVVVSGALILYALYMQPGGYTVQDVPRAFTRVVAYFLR